MTQAVVPWLPLFEDFLSKTGLQQTLRALQIEAVVLPFTPEGDIGSNLQGLANGIAQYLAKCEESKQASQSEEPQVPADPSSGDTAASNTLKPEADAQREAYLRDAMHNTLDQEQTKQKIQAFVAEQRKGIDTSNREEFLDANSDAESTCARIDAKRTNCGVALQPDLVQNSNTALGRSTDQSSGADMRPPPAPQPLCGLEERVDNIREHLSVRFVPESADIYRRVAALEDRIMTLEREFPPWSAEHFNQPRRRYMQPPPVTVYRDLPAAPDPPFTRRTPQHVKVQPQNAQSRQVHSQKAQPRTTPKHQPQPKRKKVASYADSPVDKSGRPIFHACGRGVNSSLTRSVLAQLQLRQSGPPSANNKSQPTPQEHKEKQQ
ncbi:hypothetical protein EV183_002884 [Coemansia sp. RSA 2336]|nr:hypothetical protein EV183_002884 [Coemansia sp. RSA 2336]